MGYDIDKLHAVGEYAATINTAAVVVIVDGAILYEWGEVEKNFRTHSIRKSFLSALYGDPVKSGVIDMDATLEALGIDDVPPLSEEEKMATVRDCLKARSGIYHDALYESAGMKKLKPKRFTEKAGIHWYYNNYDFNVAGTIYEKQTGKKIFDAINNEIAIPTQMEHYTPAEGNYVTGEESIHAAYPFRISAYDLARFGLLMMHDGNWNGKQLIDKDWVRESTRYHSDATLYQVDGYGYMWWVARDYNKYPHLPGVSIPEGSYSARGAGGHYLLIIPEFDMIIVHRVDTDKSGNSVSGSEMGKLTNLILSSKIK